MTIKVDASEYEKYLNNLLEVLHQKGKDLFLVLQVFFEWNDKFFR